MKKVFIRFIIIITFIIFLTPPVFAACSPPSDYSTCTEQHPDKNLEIRGWQNISNNLVYINFNHPLDRAPKLNTLIEGNSRPKITSLHEVYDWNWTTNSKGNPIQKPPDLTTNNFATLVGFNTNPGQNILVPDSAYDIGGGNEVIILFATSNQITMVYGTDDSVAYLYAIHLLNLNVNPKLLDCYNKYNSEGRKELPALTAGEILGTASGNEILVSIRDKGSFMDPRWIEDWWQDNSAAAGHSFTCKTISTGNTVEIPPSGKLFSPSRQVQAGSDVVNSISDTVKLQESANLTFPGTSRDVTRGAFFEQFSDLTIPFAQELTKYLAGPFVRDVGSNSNLIIKQFNDHPQIENAGVLAKLTSQETQDEMRVNYWRHCGGGLGNMGDYCSNRTIGKIISCPGPESNECLLSDGSEIGDLKVKPLRKNYGNTLADNQKYLADFSAWTIANGGKNSLLWPEIPLISNPKTFVGDAIDIQACPAGGGGMTTTISVPWASALKDTSDFLHQLLSSGQTNISLLPQNSPSVSSSLPNNLLASSKILSPSLLAQVKQGSFYITAEGSYNGLQLNVTVKFYGDHCDGDINLDLNGGHIAGTNRWNIAVNNPYEYGPQYTGSPFNLTPGQTLTLSYTGKVLNSACAGVSSLTCNFTPDSSGKVISNCTATAGPPGGPSCNPPSVPSFVPDGSADPIEASGHKLFRDWPKTTTLECKQWGVTTGGFTCLDGKTSVNFDDPTWAVVKYPFLSTIYKNTSGENGIFRIFKPSPNNTADWADAGESKITYCAVKDYRAESMLEPKLNIDQKSFTSPPARCADTPASYTKGLSVYPQFIGGVKNAKDWVVCLLHPQSQGCGREANQTTSPSPSPNCPSLTYTIPFRNPLDNIQNIAKVINDVKSRFPKSIINNKRSDGKTNLEYLISQAKANNWSPAFVTALWLEETGASHTVVEGTSLDALGCRPTVAKNFDDSLRCLFANFNNETDFKNFMLRYSGDTNTGCFATNPNFPANIKKEYSLTSSP